MSEFVPPSAESATEDIAEAILMGHVTELLNDSPKLQVALKNLMAVLLGSDISRRSADDELDGKVTDIKAFDLLTCSRSLIKGLSDMTFVEAPQWGARHPQPEDQSFSDRIDQISKYKAALLFFKRSKESGSGGISKMVGKKFIAWTKSINDVKAFVNTELAEKVEEDVRTLFLDTFEDSVNGVGPHADLIWCNNFAEKLSDRQVARQKEARQRKLQEEQEAVIQEGDVGEELSEAVVNMMRSSSSPPLPRVEEID